MRSLHGFTEFRSTSPKRTSCSTSSSSMATSRCCFTQGRPIEELRWITFGHLESDESGAMNLFLAAAPHAQVAHGRLGCVVNIDDLADRPPRPLDSGDVIDIGAHRLRYFATPHVPHGWDAGVYYDETTGTLLCGDLFTAVGKSKALVSSGLVGPAMLAEDMFSATCLTPQTAATMRRLAELEPTTLALMHGPHTPVTVPSNCAASPTLTTNGS